MEEMLRARYGERGQSFHVLWVCHSPQISTCSPSWKISNPIVWSFYRGFITQTKLIKSLPIGGWTQSPVPFPGGVWMWKFQSSHHGLIWQPVPHPKAIQGLPATNHLSKWYFYHSRDAKGFRSCVPGTGDKDQIFIFYYTTVSWHQIVKRSLGIISIDDIMKEGKGRIQRITVTWWMDGDKVQLDPKIGCYSYGCKQGTRNESYTPQKIRKGQSQSLVF